MPNYKGRTPGTRRIVIWHEGKPREWIVEGSKTDGDKFEARKRLELAATAAELRSAVKFSELFALYRIHAEAHLKESTWAKVRVYQVATLTEHFGELKTDKLTINQIDEFKRFRLSSKVKVGASSINNELRVFRTIVNWGRDAGHQIATVKWKPLPVRGHGRVRAWTEDELQKIYAECRKMPGPLLQLMVFMTNTGCRKGEAIAAEWSWMDFDAGMIRIPANESWQPKNGKPREIPMGDAVRALLSGPHKSPRWVFPCNRSERYREFPKDLWWEALEDSGVDGHPHMCRHTFASHFLQKVPDLFLLAQVLGHSHARVTELYAHLLPGHLERARNAVNLAPKTMALAMAEGAGKRRKKQKTG